MSIPESVIEAARATDPREHVEAFRISVPKARARRVIIALADNLPESVVTKVLEAAMFSSIRNLPIQHQRRWMRAAIVDALKDIAGETP